ncbi:fructose-bisphosphate aldolase [Macroventuria anomochaeta]|uniref:Fructose-bisphosphate aldolase n=1 Tax=Macroventuria anomochaeta TaxID=301207 RepID=A0ACB6S8E5_9PLEO|nr:fructose-bisphosphate aldolase [Macroventuria anomochaeta]KAF2629845.1 fructose-bisphosphate aldolase [Macroventuria anomochaeta]
METSHDAYPQNNLTWRILHKAQKNSYAVGAFNCYNDDGVLAVIRAAEAKKSPAIIQLFPWTLHFQGPDFVRYVVARAHAASVPIAVHLDHCIDDSDVETALSLPLDSIMVDASGLEPETNIAYCSGIARRAAKLGITVEAEMGRIEGGEDGLKTMELEGLLTDPHTAQEFVRRTGVHFLAPSFGNVHGPYPPGGAEKFWQLDRLQAIGKAVGNDIPLVLHGTHPVADELFHEAMARGIVKINLNRNVRDEYTAFVGENWSKDELTQLKEKAVKVYAKSIERAMDMLRSSGKAA